MSNTQEAGSGGAVGWGGSETESTQIHGSQPSNMTNKRKPMKERSTVWEHFEKIVQLGEVDITQAKLKRVRDAVRWIRNSPARFKKFKEYVDLEGIESKSSLCLDVPTRWNSTYLMLSTAEKFEKAFDRYEEMDPSFKGDLGEDGISTFIDWICVRKYASLLKHFYDATNRISGSSYVTSNTFFREISNLCAILNEWKESMDYDLRNLGDTRKKKFDKYWGDVDNMNMIIFFATIFDPRDKMEYMEYTLVGMYGKEKGVKFFQNVKKDLAELFNEYKQKYQGESEASEQGSELSVSDEFWIYRNRYKKEKLDGGDCGESNKSELEIYLSEAALEGMRKMDVLKWWKVNSERLPIFSKMARDILAVPISTVVSESAFSAGGRVLDSFRSSLTPKVVEALICGQDWLRGSRSPISVEELIEEVEKFEKDLPNVGATSNI